MPAAFKDHFSQQSGGYAKYRPRYPAALYEYLVSLTKQRELALDVATGSGQAAVALSSHFAHVIATDASASQLQAAQAHSGVSYAVALAEKSGLSESSVDLMTVAQAFHWFNAKAFFDEARCVLRRDGVLAIWLYEVSQVDAECDAIVDRLYSDIVGPFWPAERQIIDDGYADVALPGKVIESPRFQMTEHWTAHDMLGYLRTWSACKRYQAQHGLDPVEQIEGELQQAWGHQAKAVAWPLVLKVCRPNKAC